MTVLIRVLRLGDSWLLQVMDMVVLTASLPPLEETQQRAGASLPDKGGLPGRSQAGPVANQKLAESKSLLVAQQAAWDKKKQARDPSGLSAVG